MATVMATVMAMATEIQNKVVELSQMFLLFQNLNT